MYQNDFKRLLWGYESIRIKNDVLQFCCFPSKYYQIQYSNLSHHTKYGHIPLVKPNDLRFQFHRANVFMVPEKRILSQSLLFWLNEFLKI